MRRAFPVVSEVERMTAMPRSDTPAPKVVAVLLVMRRAAAVFEVDPRSVRPLVTVIVDEKVAALAMVTVLVLAPIVTTPAPDADRVSPDEPMTLVVTCADRNTATPVLSTDQVFDVPLMSLPVPTLVTCITFPEPAPELVRVRMLLFPVLLSMVHVVPASWKV